MKRKLFFFTLFFSLLVGIAWAEVSLKAEVDKTRITTDEALTYKVSVTALANRLPTPQLPDFAGFQVISQARSTNISWEKGGARTTLVYAYVLAPTALGKFKLGPSTLKIKDQLISSEGFEIEVVEGEQRLPKTPQEKSPALPKPPFLEPDEPQVTL